MKRAFFAFTFAAALAGCGDPTNSNGDGPAPDLTMTAVKTDVALEMPQNGFQMATDKADIPSGEEWQACYFFKVPDLNKGQPFYVNKITMAQNIGSHHMNIFRQNTIVPPDPMDPSVGLKGPNPDGTGSVISRNGMGACFKSPNWADWPLVVNNQDPNIDDKGVQTNYVLDLTKNPKGDKIGYKFNPGEILMLQSHFVNASTQKTPHRAYAVANFDMAMDTTGIMEVASLFATKQSISICKNDPTPNFTGFCKMKNPLDANMMPVPLTIIAANGHFHSRGKNFKMRTWDGMSIDPAVGQMFYESNVWDEPPQATGLNVAAPVGGGISWTCSFQWAPSPACMDGCSCLIAPKSPPPMGECCYGFGGVVERSEHCNAFVYYYPKIDRTDISCM